MLGAFGIALSMVVGGLFNFYEIISPLSVHIYLYAGAALFTLYLIENRRTIISGLKNTITTFKADKILAASVMFLVVFLCARILLSVSFYDMNHVDDYQGYIVFPVKMIQTGALGPDPFSERRIMSSLGGQYFLDTFTLSSLDTKYLHIIDNCVSYLFFLALIYELLSLAKIDHYLKVSLFTLLLLIASPTTNITSFITAALLLLGLFTLLIKSEKKKSEIFLLTPLIIAALATSKSNMIIPMALIAAYYYFSVFEKTVPQWNKLKIQDALRGIALYICAPGALVVLLI